MRIISRSTLKKFWEQSRYKDSEEPLKSWFDEAKQANWKSPQDIKDKFRKASFLNNNRVVFDIQGNKYRLIVAIKYEFGICYIRFIGTHKQYDQIDANNV